MRVATASSHKTNSSASYEGYSGNARKCMPVSTVVLPGRRDSSIIELSCFAVYEYSEHVGSSKRPPGCGAPAVGGCVRCFSGKVLFSNSCREVWQSSDITCEQTHVATSRHVPVPLHSTLQLISNSLQKKCSHCVCIIATAP
jgi:hypothetical protein